MNLLMMLMQTSKQQFYNKYEIGKSLKLMTERCAYQNIIHLWLLKRPHLTSQRSSSWHIAAQKMKFFIKDFFSILDFFIPWYITTPKIIIAIL